MKYSLIFVGSAAIAASIGLVQAAPVNLATPEKLVEGTSSSKTATTALVDSDKIPRLRFDDPDQTMTWRLDLYRSSNVRSDEPLPELKRSHSDPALKHLRTEFKPAKNFGIKDPEDVYFAPVSTKLQRTLSDFGKAEPRTLLTQARQKGLDKVPKGNHRENFPLTVQESKVPNIVESFWRKGRAWQEWLTRDRSKKFRHLRMGWRSSENMSAASAYSEEMDKYPSEVGAKFLYFDDLESTAGLKPKEAAQLRALEQRYPSIAARRKEYEELEAPYKRLNRVHQAHQAAETIFHSHNIKISKALNRQAEEARNRARAVKASKGKVFIEARLPQKVWWQFWRRNVVAAPAK